MSDLTDALESEATEAVKSATVDGQTVTGRDLRELIDADRYLREKEAAARSGGLGVRLFNTKPPGSV